jgi:hypothetical protein
MEMGKMKGEGRGGDRDKCLISILNRLCPSFFSKHAGPSSFLNPYLLHVIFLFISDTH